MNKLFAAVLGLSISFAIMFYYNMGETQKMDQERAATKEDRNLQEERFNSEFTSANLDFADTKRAKEQLLKDLNRSESNIKKIMTKREAAQKKYEESVKRSEDEFKEVQDVVDAFEEDDFLKDNEKISETEFDFEEA